MRTYKTLHGLLQYFERTCLAPHGLTVTTVTPQASGFYTVCVARIDATPGCNPTERVNIHYEGPGCWELSEAVDAIQALITRAPIVNGQPLPLHVTADGRSGVWLRSTTDNHSPPSTTGD